MLSEHVWTSPNSCIRPLIETPQGDDTWSESCQNEAFEYDWVDFGTDLKDL